MKIAAFSQLHNELSKRNLENWFKCVNSFCDCVYIYDQNSTDGSLEYYTQFANVKVIRSETNDFQNEIKCKSKLLKYLLSEEPDVDWIFWLDGDTVVEQRMISREFVESVLLEADAKNLDGLSLGHQNLWRSETYKRIDNEYDWLNRNGVVCFWKNNGKLEFPEISGLHQKQYPNGIERTERAELSLIHRGFSTDRQIIDRYTVYKARGQSGWALERLIDESTLKVERLDLGMIPSWLQAEEDSPLNKKHISEIMANEEKR